MRWVVAGLSVAVVLAAAPFVLSIGKDQHQGLHVMTGFTSDVYPTSGEDVVDTTGEGPCARLSRCVQSAGSERVRIMRFSSRDSAERYVLQLAPHGYQPDWFVVELLQPETMTRQDHRFVESAVHGTANDPPD